MDCLTSEPFTRSQRLNTMPMSQKSAPAHTSGSPRKLLAMGNQNSTVLTRRMLPPSGTTR